MAPPPPPPSARTYNGLPPVDWYPEPDAPAPAMPHHGAPQPMYQPVFTPDGQSCQQCGGAPATLVKFGRVTGLILWFRVERVEAVTCRSCGRSVGRRLQSKTMITGWWGFFAFFCNLYWILRNSVTLARLGRLTEPVQRTQAPLAPGRPVFLRAGIVVTLVIFGAAGAGLAMDTASWSEGSCIRYVSGSTTDLEPVDCGQANLGRIVAVVSADATCPVTTDSVVQVEGESDLYCIDEPI